MHPRVVFVGLVALVSLRSDFAVAQVQEEVLFPWDSSRGSFRYTGGPHGGGQFPACPQAQVALTLLYGLDFGMNKQEALAMASGVVQDFGFDAVIGNYIKVNHGTWTSAFWHLDSVEPTVQTQGLPVPRGRLLGVSGDTGSGAQGNPHLHVQLSKTWQGMKINGWTVRAVKVPGSSTLGINYEGTMTQGSETSVEGDLACVKQDGTHDRGLRTLGTTTAYADSATGTLLTSRNVRNTDTMPGLSINDVSVIEGNTGTTDAMFRVTLNPTSDKTVTVNYTTADGTAKQTAGDYAKASGLLTFSPGESFKGIVVKVNGDLLNEVHETFFVNLSGATNAVIVDRQGMGTITNDDPQPTISINDVSGSEAGGKLDFTVSLSAASGQTVTVLAQTANGTATAGNDYTATGPSTLSLSPGTTSKVFSVPIINDSTAEANETFFVNLSKPKNATIARAQGIATILNDDFLASNTWTPLSTVGASPPRSGPSAIWTGTEMIILGGDQQTDLLQGGRYNPVSNTWSPLTFPTARAHFSVVWIGSELLLWGGEDNTGPLGSGYRYNPMTNVWTTLPTTGNPAPRRAHSAVWTGTEMIVWGGSDTTCAECSPTGDRFNPLTNTWQPLPTQGAPEGRSQFTAVWTGTEMIVWGGHGQAYFNNGGRFNPATNTWSSLPSTDLAPRYLNSAVWTGSEVIIWGGFCSGAPGNMCGDGARFNPTTNVWTRLPTGGAPSVRGGHTAVWTGIDMLIWGGLGCVGCGDPSVYAYSPVANVWRSPATVGAPSSRAGHSAIWTGTEMIIWGGVNETYTQLLNDGGRYRP